MSNPDPSSEGKNLPPVSESVKKEKARSTGEGLCALMTEPDTDRSAPSAPAEPSEGDTVHIVGHGPAIVKEEVGSQPSRRDGVVRKYFSVQYPNGTVQRVSRDDILAYEPPRRQISPQQSAPGSRQSSRGRSRQASILSPIMGPGAQSPRGGRGPRQVEYLGRAFNDSSRIIRLHSATFSLVATMIGGGVLSLPYAVSQCGLALGFIALFGSGVAGAWTLDMLIDCARCTGRDAFELVGHAAFGEGARKLTVGLVFLTCWFCQVAYFVLLGDLLVPVAELAHDWQLSPAALRSGVITLAALVLSPMCFKSSMAAMRFLCFASVGSVMLVGAIVVVRAGQEFGMSHLVAVKKEDQSISMVNVDAVYRWWPEDWVKALYCFPTFGVSYLCHFNALSTHRELVRPTRYRVRKMLIITFALTSVLYCIVGGAGYLYAGACTCGNILLNFRRDDTLVTISRVALGIVLMLNFPLIVQPCRDALFRLLPKLSCCRTSAQTPEAAHEAPMVASTLSGDREQVRTLQEQGRVVSDLSLVAEGSFSANMGVPLTSEDGVPDAMVHVYRSEDMRRNMVHGETMTAFDAFRPKDDTVQQSASEPTRLQRYLLTILLLASALAISCAMKSIMVVWSMLGSTVCFMIQFILPGAFWYRIVSPTAHPCSRCAAGFLVGVSSIAAIVCFILTCIYIHAPACPYV